MNDLTGRPNLFIIGAMKSGTTSLHEYLGSHPEIGMSRVKEPGFFVEELALNKGVEWYLSLFEARQRYRYAGESSTHYTKLPLYQGVPGRIFSFNPEARLIYIMRDPFQRTISHYWHAVRDIHHGGESRPPLRAVLERPEYLAFSDYALQLEPYFNVFGREAIYTLTFEALVRDPQSEVNRIYDWLGLSRHPIEREIIKAHNQKPASHVGIAGRGVLNRVRYSRTWNSLSRYVPQALKTWAIGRAYKSFEEETAQDEMLQLKHVIADRQKRQLDNLCRLLGRDFPEWLGTHHNLAIDARRPAIPQPDHPDVAPTN